MQHAVTADVGLVMDEEQGTQEVLCRALRKAGYRVLVTRNAADALRVIGRFRRGSAQLRQTRYLRSTERP